MLTEIACYSCWKDLVLVRYGENGFGSAFQLSNSFFDR
jgi:hypothetical protein